MTDQPSQTPNMMPAIEQHLKLADQIGEDALRGTLDHAFHYHAIRFLMRELSAARRDAMSRAGITEKMLKEAGFVRRGGARLTFQGGVNTAPTAVEYYNPYTGHAVLEFVGIQPVLLEKGKEDQYERRYLYWAALTKESDAAMKDAKGGQ